MSERELRTLRFRVAAFVIATVTALLVMTLTLGRSRGVLSRNVTLHTSFENVAGLVRGTQVRLAGVNIGIVSSIHFSDDPRVRRVYVDLSVREKHLNLIRADSMAKMSSKGLLGDNVVDVTLGSEKAPPLKEDDILRSAEAVNLTSTLDQANAVLTKLDRFADGADKGLRSVLTPEFSANVGRISKSTADLLETTQRGDGLAHQLLYDPGLGRDAKLAVRDSRAVADQLARTVGELDAVVARVRRGNGVLHGMIYSDGGAQTLKDLQATMADLADVTQQIRTGNGIAHTILYEESAANLVQDLSEAARIVRRLATQTEQGKGTVGGLLKDPTVYEDLTAVLGNVKRNTLLKALIRFTIRNKNLKRSAAASAQSDVPPAAPQGTGGSPQVEPSAVDQPDPEPAPAK